MIDKLYLKSPHWLKNILISLYGLKEMNKSKGAFFKKRYKILKNNLKLSQVDLQDAQVKSLNRLLRESMTYCEYYNKLYVSCGISEQLIKENKASDILLKIPYLEKQILRTQMKDLVSSSPSRVTSNIIHTSGTTGMPLAIEMDRESKQSTAAEWKRYNDWLGLPDAFSSIRFSGRIIVSPTRNKPPFWVYNAPKKQLFMSTYHLTDSNLTSYIKKINQMQPQLLDGYPSAFYILASFMKKNKIRLNYKPIAISTTAETLLDNHRNTIEEMFGCRVYNQYASSEGSPWIVQCRLGSYHLWTDTGVFEYIDQKDNGDGTIMSELVVTSFRNFKTPLIRYRIGDMINRYKGEKKCTCGSSFPIIHSIIGRMDDVLFTKEKGKVGRLDPVFKGLSGIKQSKISQVDINTVKVFIIPDNSFTLEIGQQLLKNLHDRLGVDISIELVETKKIDLGKNGKFKNVERLFKIEEEMDK